MGILPSTRRAPGRRRNFAIIPVTDEQGRTTALGVDQSKAIREYLKESGYVDGKGRVPVELRKSLADKKLRLPEPFQQHLPQVRDILRKLAGKLDVKDANQQVSIKTRQAILHSPEFQTLSRVDYAAADGRHINRLNKAGQSGKGDFMSLPAWSALPNGTQTRAMDTVRAKAATHANTGRLGKLRPRVDSWPARERPPRN